jgi:DNA polymerase-3 subunit epsilon
VAFDYGFVRSEFRRLGFDYKRDQLCTVKLSRKLIPGHRSYSLGRICEELNIAINGRHRAMGDAVATAGLFDLLLSIDASNPVHFLGETPQLLKGNHSLLDPGKIKKLPEEPGVYYFYNQETELIYIGKSKNIRNRVSSHFSSSAKGKGLKMCSQVADVGCESTGSELVALLKESFEIKQYKPLYNRRQRRSLFRYELISYTDSSGYIRFELQKTTGTDENILMCFTTKAEAHNFMHRMVEKYALCQKLCGLYPSDGNCFHYEIGACKGACLGKEPPVLYNLRAAKAIAGFDFGMHNLLIIDAGRNFEEKSVIKIEHGKFIGFGYYTAAFAENDQSIIHECIHSYPDNREVQQIIKQYLRNNKVDRVIVY